MIGTGGMRGRGAGRSNDLLLCNNKPRLTGEFDCGQPYVPDFEAAVLESARVD